MTDLDKPVVRRTPFKGRGQRAMVATITPGGLSLHLERTRDHYKLDWETLWRWAQKENFCIPPREK